MIIHNNKVALIKRIKKDVTYYVFSGGGVEDMESPEDATVREAYEELGITVKIKSLHAVVDFRGKEYFFLCEIIKGEFGTGDGPEFHDSSEESGAYIPLWEEINNLDSLDIRPREIAEMISKKKC